MAPATTTLTTIHIEVTGSLPVSAFPRVSSATTRHRRGSYDSFPARPLVLPLRRGPEAAEIPHLPAGLATPVRGSINFLGRRRDLRRRAKRARRRRRQRFRFVLGLLHRLFDSFRLIVSLDRVEDFRHR